MLSFYCQNIFFGLEMKFFVVQRKYNFKHTLQNYFKKRRLITLRWFKALKINKFIMLRLSEAMKNEVMRIKIVYFDIHTIYIRMERGTLLRLVN